MSDFKVKLLADSICKNGDRLSTFELTYPRQIHAEVLTHRMFSRNSASSRAIPSKKLRASIAASPFIPHYWGLNQAGMQASKEASPEQIAEGEQVIREMLEFCLKGTEKLEKIGFHKQLANRYIEPWMWITVILSTTSFEHFRRLRNHHMAEPHFQKLARMMCDVYDGSMPKLLNNGDWHLPLTGFPGDEGLTLRDRIQLSAARCARVSYLTHEGLRDVGADYDLHNKLATDGHWSPFEHVAQAMGDKQYYGNFRSFKQYRKEFKNEFIPDPDGQLSLGG